MSLQSHVKLQDDIHVRMSRAKINFKKSPKDRITTQYLDTRLEMIEELWAQFSVTHTQIIRDIEYEQLTSSPYTVNEVYFNTEELYLDLKCELKSALCRLQKSDVSQAMGSSDNSSPGKSMTIKLPRITIPTFSGKYTEWPTFRDLFVSAIHNNSTIDNVQKLHYLKSYLTGEAEQLLRHIPISETNYERSWAQLETRYNNRKYLSHCILVRLLSQKNIVQESASALKELMDTTLDCLNALNNLDIDVTSWDIIIVHIVTSKLDPDSRKDWELKVTSNVDSDELPTFEQLKEFLTSRYRALEFLGTKSSKNIVCKERVFHTAANTTKVCPVCNSSEHKIRNCKQFINKDVDIRRKFVQDHNLCFNCLGYNHSARLCKCTASCRICKRRHHSLLHPKGERESGVKGDSSTRAYSTTVGVESQNNIVSCFSKGGVSSQVLLPTALVRAVSENGGLYTIRALLDQGSQASFITEGTVQRLGLKKKAVKGSITGIKDHNKLVLNSVVEVKIQSRIDPSFELVVEAYVLKSITSYLPGRETSYLDWAQVSDIELADPRYHKPDKVDMLLGADIYSQILQNGFKKGLDGSTVAQATTLGWIISGTVAYASQNISNITVMHTHLSESEILKKKLGKEHMREKQTYNQMNELLAKRGFTVQNGLSNSSELLGKIIGKAHSFKGLDDVGKEINSKQAIKLSKRDLPGTEPATPSSILLSYLCGKNLKLKEKRILPYLDTVYIVRVGGRQQHSLFIHSFHLVIKENNLPTCRWLLGRVVEKHSGLDKLTRVVTIRSNGSMFKGQHPSCVYCLLPRDIIS